jgi:hypothetical protein
MDSSLKFIALVVVGVILAGFVSQALSLNATTNG